MVYRKKGKMSKQYDVISMGSSVIDNFLYTGIGEKKGLICFPIGTKIQIKKIEFSVGGGGANTSTCFSHLGLKTGYLGKVGKGSNSEIILKKLRENKVDFLGVQGKEHAGYSVILEGDKKHRTILTYKGASDGLKFSEIDFGRLKTKWFYFTSMADESFKSQKKIAEFAKKRGIKLAYNPSSYQTKFGAEYLHSILKNTDVLTLNKEEAQMLVKKGSLFKGLIKLGPKIVCITDGENEGGVYDGEFLYRFRPNKVKVKEMTGAGDSFGSSFIAGLIKSEDVENALKIAMVNAESVIQKHGGQSGLLGWKEMERIIKVKKFRIRKEVL